MTTLSSMGQNGKASTVKKTFSRTTTINQKIDAEIPIVWKLLTNAPDYPRWNSTIVSIEGKIEQGEKIKLISTIDSSRKFKLKVIELITNQKPTWGNAIGKRTYTLEKQGNQTLFSMTEKIQSIMPPLFADKIPSFDTSFEQFTADLKNEAELK